MIHDVMSEVPRLQIVRSIEPPIASRRHDVDPARIVRPGALHLERAPPTVERRPGEIATPFELVQRRGAELVTFALEVAEGLLDILDHHLALRGLAAAR